MSAFAPDALTDALAEESVSQTRACAAALGSGSGITSGFADWRKTGAITAIESKVIAKRMDTFQFAPGFSQTQVCQQATLRNGNTAAGVLLPGSRLLDFMAKRPTLTTDSGMPVADNQNSITAGPRGPQYSSCATR
jgi:hypothetical protein